MFGGREYLIRLYTTADSNSPRPELEVTKATFRLAAIFRTDLRAQIGHENVCIGFGPGPVLASGNIPQMAKPKREPRCVVIAGPNGAGKTTFARRYLPEHADVVHFVNADLIASGLSPLKPELAAIAAARLVLQEIDRLAAERMDFAFETTCSGVTYVRRLEAWKQAGYRVEIVYLRLRSAKLALRRIAARVRQGGHDVPRADVLRRFARGWENFHSVYRPLADSWTVYDNSGRAPRLLEKSS
jgi:predicted ABC-type ATPase